MAKSMKRKYCKFRAVGFENHFLSDYVITKKKGRYSF